MAKDLVRNKRFVTKMLEMRSHLWGVEQRMAEMSSTKAMTDAMRSAGQAMVRMNKQMNLPAMNKTARIAMERENGHDPGKIGDSIDDAGDEAKEEEEEAVRSSSWRKLVLIWRERVAAPTAAVICPA